MTNSSDNPKDSSRKDSSRADRSVVVMSGGSRGLGQALATDLLQRGQVVATFSRSKTPFIEECLAQHGDAFLWRQLDASDGAGLRAFALTVAREHGRIDALINNAAIAIEGSFSLARDSDLENSLAVNLAAVLKLTRACSRTMLSQGRGVIVNISSVNAIRGHEGVAIYSATKAALDGLTRSLARELGPRGIRVVSVAPGYFESDMSANLTPEQHQRIVRRTPLGRLGTVEDLVGVIRFLISPQASFITGQTVVVDGGITC